MLPFCQARLAVLACTPAEPSEKPTIARLRRARI